MSDIPRGGLNRYGLENIIIQGDDVFFSELEDRWEKVPPTWIGRVASTVFGPHVHVDGNLWRLSDAVHKCNFKAKYGIEKPEPLVERNPIYSRGELHG
jgi:hypothetical protein